MAFADELELPNMRLDELPNMMLHALESDERDLRDRTKALYVTDATLAPGSTITFIEDTRSLMGTERFSGDKFVRRWWVTRQDHHIPTPRHLRTPATEIFHCYFHTSDPDDGASLLCICVRHDSIQDGTPIRTYIFRYVNHSASYSAATLVLRKRKEDSLFPEYEVLSLTTNM